eukprot:g4647.t1
MRITASRLARAQRTELRNNPEARRRAEEEKKRKKEEAKAIAKQLKETQDVKTVEEGEEDDNDFHCSLCERVDCILMDGTKDRLLCCDGPCLRSFHLSCLELDDLPDDEEWFCRDCTAGSHACQICGKTGRDNTRHGVVKCSLEKCGLFFHTKCLESFGQNRSRSDVFPSNFTIDKDTNVAKFVCPAHACETCVNVEQQADLLSTFGKQKKKKKSQGLVKCLRCPTSYHPNCIPPTARHNAEFLLCPTHRGSQLPPPGEEMASFYENLRGKKKGKFDSSSFGASTSVLRRLKFMKTEPPLHRASHPGHFRLVTSILTEVRSKPPSYKKIRTNRYLGKPKEATWKPNDDVAKCSCTDVCDDRCENRMLRVECYKGMNCNVGEGCGNRQIQLQKYVPLECFRRLDIMGWGVKTCRDVKAGEFIMQYVGEVINEEERNRRLAELKRKGEAQNVYIMSLGTGEEVDAHFMGNIARFINHSCDPNCYLERWNVGGRSKIAIFALRDLKEGEELCYDYKFASKERTVCRCGADNCRGFLGVDVAMEERKTEKEMVKFTRHFFKDGREKPLTVKHARQLLREKEAFLKRLNEEREEEEVRSLSRLTLTSKFLPGVKSKMSKIKNGPEMPSVQHQTLCAKLCETSTSGFLYEDQMVDKVTLQCIEVFNWKKFNATKQSFQLCTFEEKIKESFEMDDDESSSVIQLTPSHMNGVSDDVASLKSGKTKSGTIGTTMVQTSPSTPLQSSTVEAVQSPLSSPSSVRRQGARASSFNRIFLKRSIVKGANILERMDRFYANEVRRTEIYLRGNVDPLLQPCYDPKTKSILHQQKMKKKKMRRKKMKMLQSLESDDFNENGTKSNERSAMQSPAVQNTMKKNKRSKAKCQSKVPSASVLKENKRKGNRKRGGRKKAKTATRPNENGAKKGKKRRRPSDTKLSTPSKGKRKKRRRVVNCRN